MDRRNIIQSDEADNDWNTDSTSAARRARRHRKNRSRNSSKSNSSKSNSSKSSRNSSKCSSSREFNKGYKKSALKKKGKTDHRFRRPASSASSGSNVSVDSSSKNPTRRLRSSRTKSVQFRKSPADNQNGFASSHRSPNSLLDDVASLENQSTSGGSETAVNSGFQLPLSQSFIRNSSTATLDRLCYVLLAELFRRHKKLENIENKRVYEEPLAPLNFDLDEGEDQRTPLSQRRPSSSSHGGGIVDEYGSHKKDDVQYKTPKHHGSGNLLSPGISAHWQSSHPGWRDGKYLVEENRWQYRSSNKKGQRLPSENDVEFNTDERWFRNERTPSKSAAPARPVGIFFKGGNNQMNGQSSQGTFKGSNNPINIRPSQGTTKSPLNVYSINVPEYY